MVLERLRKKYKDPEDVLAFLEDAFMAFERIAPGRLVDREVETLEEALESSAIAVYVREADVTLLRERVLGAEPIEKLIEEIESEFGQTDPLESVVNELRTRLKALCEDPNLLYALPPDALGELLVILSKIPSNKPRPKKRRVFRPY